jgi:hypothetical protein
MKPKKFLIGLPWLVGKAGQADQVIEFLRADSELAQAVNKEYVAFKEVERPKYLPKTIVKTMHAEGCPGSKLHHHTELWKSLDARKEGKGLGVTVAGAWYWHQPGLDLVRSYCSENAGQFR